MVDVVDLTNIEQVKIIPSVGRVLIIANINHREKRMIQGYDKVGRLIVSQSCNKDKPIWVSGVSPQAKSLFTNWIREELTKDTEEGMRAYANG